MRVLLIATYELGRQPFGLASPAAWLREAGAEVDCLDLSVQTLDDNLVGGADFVAVYLPMHTATRIACSVIGRVRDLNPAAELCAFGLYAPLAESELRELGVRHLIGGEFEAELTACVLEVGARRSSASAGPLAGSETASIHPRERAHVSMARLPFRVPDRQGLPGLEQYARLRLVDGTERVVGTTEASRGCKYRCRHCPVVPVYDGVFRVVPPDVVLADIEQQARAGAEHITFGDPDFLNGPAHAARIVRDLHARHPGLTYDITAKIEHLLRHADMLPLLRDTGCALVTSAAESVDDRVLQLLDKGHTRADFAEVVRLCRDVGLSLQPTFVAFTPWTELSGYSDLLRTVTELGLAGQVAPIQLAIRLLIPRRSRLLESEEVQRLVGPYDASRLVYPWRHPDRRVDELQQHLEQLIGAGMSRQWSRDEIFGQVWVATHEALRAAGLPAEWEGAPARATIPFLTEPWYC